MTLFTYTSIALILILMIIDFTAYPKNARKALFWMAATFRFLLLFILNVPVFEKISKTLGVGRPVDILIYLSIIFFWRSFFRSQLKNSQINRDLTNLTRYLALKEVKSFEKKSK